MERNNNIRKKKIPPIRKCTQCSNPTRYPYPQDICRKCYEDNCRNRIRRDNQNKIAAKYAGTYRRPGIEAKIKQGLLHDD